MAKYIYDITELYPVYYISLTDFPDKEGVEISDADAKRFKRIQAEFDAAQDELDKLFRDERQRVPTREWPQMKID